MIGRMPVAGGEHGKPGGSKTGDPVVERCNDLIAFRNREATAGQEIVLHIDNQECVARLRLSGHGQALRGE